MCNDESSDESEQEEERDYNDCIGGEEVETGDTSNASIDCAGNTMPFVTAVTDSLLEGFGTIFPPYRAIIVECIQSVFKIDAPTDWQILLIQSLVFPYFDSPRRIMCIRQTGDGKSLPIQCVATMRRYVSVVVVPLISIGADQVSNIYYCCNPQAGIYAEHLDSLRETDDRKRMVDYLNSLTHSTLKKTSVILYLSPSAISHGVWAPVLKLLISKGFIRFFCVDECHHVTSAGRYFRPDFFLNIRFIIGRLWNKCPMLFCSATMNRTSMHHMSLMLHPESSLTTMRDLPKNIGLDDVSIEIPTIDPLPTKFLTALMWGEVGRDGIDFVVEYNCNWYNSITTPLIEYTRAGCKAMVYCSSAIEARDKVKLAIQSILREAGVCGDTVVLTGSDGVMMKSYLVDLFAGKTSSVNCRIAVVVGTSAVNCGISSPQLYYIFVKGFLRSLNELVQLMGRLKRGKGDRLKQDRIHVMLSLPHFCTMYYTILSESDESERDRQLCELRIATSVLMCRDKCIRQSIEEYYGAKVPDPPLTCPRLCPSCRGELSKKIKRSNLIDHLEADVFDQGSVTLGTFATKLITKKNAIWVGKSMDVKPVDAHVLTILLWVHNIITIHWSTASTTKDMSQRTKKDVHCSFKKKPAGSAMRMNHRDDQCWIGIPCEI